MQSIQKYRNQLNQYGRDKVPFLFILDYDLENPLIFKTEESTNDVLMFDIEGFVNYTIPKRLNEIKEFQKSPEPFIKYAGKFIEIMHNIRSGYTYLLNLTCETPISTNLSLKEIFYLSKAPYKLWYNDDFVVFSPEPFICIENNTISTFPMKGTIDASLIDAEQQILNNFKELAEHATIVDLLRNDLSMIAQDVKVEKYRYIDRIQTNQKELLQVSSKITGKLPDNYRQYLGNILFTLLPAGSVTGAPKKKTVEIIKQVEGYKRGYYTGVFGYFDGINLKSAVMIRFIEKKENGLFYKSGGGITFFSNDIEEYNEMIDKIYVPVS
jgi:para-aminobenzoate synthetase component I